MFKQVGIILILLLQDWELTFRQYTLVFLERCMHALHVMHLLVKPRDMFI